LFTSPHLVRFNERIRVAGRLIEDEALAALLEEVLQVSDDIEPSFFEVATAAAFLAFARTPADACIVEVGLGGRLDATNVLERPLVCGIAGLGIDHKQFLGSNAGEIAAEKAGIAKAGVPLVTQRYPPLVAQRVHQAAEQAGAPWIARGALWDARVIRDHIRYRDRSGALKLPVPTLPGRFQADNAALAVAMLRFQDQLPVPEKAMAAAMASAEWPARLQRLGPGSLTRLLPKGSELWVDGGHNSAAARRIASFARREFRDGLPLVLLFASLSSKDPKGMLRPFAGVAAGVHALPIADHDCRPPEELSLLADKLGFVSNANASLRQALKRIKRPARVLIFGSLYLAGEALAANGQPPD
jgi:dihydrofolate synthase/folylpolyglutamate synthase